MFDFPNLSLRLKRNTYVDKILNKQCYKCESIKPPHAHHCNSCGRCIALMDHHCPWINNCVGFYTQKLFLLFNIYCLIAICYALGILFTHGVEYIVESRMTETLVFDNKEFFLCALCIFELIFFGLFIIVVVCDQVSIILNRLTTIDRVRLHDNRLLNFKKRGMKNFKEVFGGSFSWTWFVPIAIKHDISMEQLYN